jgi:hypothetical protein
MVSVYRLAVISGGILWSFDALHGAQLIINGGFDSNLSAWTIEGSVSPSSGFALIEEDPDGGDSAIFQTVGAVGNPLLLSFELFVDGMSPNVPDGLLPDTAFGTVYFGDAAFGAMASAGTFDESLSLFDLDRTGISNLESSLMMESIAARPGWVRMTVPLNTTRNFVTFVVEEVNLNGTRDSTLAIDAVSIDVIPEPSMPLLLAFVLGLFIARRNRPT